jgi:hypothetical protein
VAWIRLLQTPWHRWPHGSQTPQKYRKVKGVWHFLSGVDSGQDSESYKSNFANNYKGPQLSSFRGGADS